MSKKHRKDQFQAQPGAQAQPAVPAQNDPQPSPQLQPASGGPAAQAVDNTKKYFILFWSAVVLAVGAAWGLAVLLDKPEFIIERWIMAGFGLFLVLFLLIYK